MASSPQWSFPPFRLDPDNACLWRGDERLTLPPKPLAVLAHLVVHAGQLVSKEALLDAVWPETVVTEGVLKRCILQIRRALGETVEDAQYIATVHRRGYRFMASVTRIEPPVAAAPLLPDASSPRAPLSLEVERRQLTVLFCDLVESTRLASQLDPEDLREVVRAYQQHCVAVIERFDGHIAQYLGDGLLIYFGYPRAHEDDAQRATHAGLGILEALPILNAQLTTRYQLQVAVRVGIHTGLVVIGEMGGSGRQEQLALGATPNVAFWLQSLASPNTVLMSDATYQLVEGYFTLTDLGPQPLKGVGTSVHVYQVLRASGVQTRFEVALRRGLTPLVGREADVAFLVDRWAQAKEGRGQVVVLSGEAGIGKSRLVQVLKEHLRDMPHRLLECRSSPYYQNTALYPLADLLQHALPWQPDDVPAAKLGKLEAMLSSYGFVLEETVPFIALLLSLPVPKDRYPPSGLSSQRQRQRMLGVLVTLLLAWAEQQPVVFILEDLHWTDPTTLEFLDVLIEQIPTAAIYALLTCRPTFQPAWRPRSYLTQVMLDRLSRAQTQLMVARITGGIPLPAEVLHHIVEKTDGVPLYVEEVTKAVLESRLLEEIDEQYELVGVFSALAIPASLQDALMARLDRLHSAKGIVQLGATIGRQFSYVLLHAVAEYDALTLQRELSRLVEAELLYQRGVPPQATYLFKHALITDIAYASLLKSTRQHYHQRIATVLETQFPDTAATQPELLAHHYTEAGLHEQAIRYWQRAGEQAIQRSAHVEASVHLRKGLVLLAALPDTSARYQQELTLQLLLGVVLTATKGSAAPEVGHAYIRAWALCQQIEEMPQHFSVLSGLWRFYSVRGQLQTGRELVEQLLILAQERQDPALLMEAHFAVGNTLLWLGEFAQAHAHLAQGIALYTPQQQHSLAFFHGQDPGVCCQSFAACALWYLGYPDQALQQSEGAITLAQGQSHAYSLALALNFVIELHQLRQEWQNVQERAEELLALSKEQEFALWFARGTILHGWALAKQQQGVRGIAQVERGLVAYQTTGAERGRPYYLMLLADAYGTVGQPEAGLAILDEALAVLHKTGEHIYEAEIHRLKGALLLLQSSDTHAEAEACFQQSLVIARHQHAKSLELRAAISLSRLWQQQSKRRAARQLLAEVYGWFTEGFDTVDLQEAQAVLAELQG